VQRHLMRKVSPGYELLFRHRETKRRALYGLGILGKARTWLREIRMRPY